MIFDDLYSRRNANPCEQFIYDSIPEGCRLQIKYIVNDFFDHNHIAEFCDENIWPSIREGLKRLHQTKSLYHEALHKTFGGYINPSAEVLGYLEEEQDFNKTMDTIEVICRVVTNIEKMVSGSGYQILVRPEHAIINLNVCLSNNCIGYKFEGNMLIRIDNELLYSNITKNVIVLLSNPDYFNINTEYMPALRHYRVSDYEDCIVNCKKAFESTMKVICEMNSAFSMMI
jgi:AbiJ N-terminal domain 4